ncbi:MAG: hypothetical protein MK160_01855 [Rhodobacteraceae bacterium]|nr:hypothetical protein [Paracoccaceae bacterium]
MFRPVFLSALGTAVATPVSSADKRFEVTRTDAEWRAMVSPLECVAA